MFILLEMSKLSWIYLLFLLFFNNLISLRITADKKKKKKRITADNFTHFETGVLCSLSFLLDRLT